MPTIKNMFIDLLVAVVGVAMSAWILSVLESHPNYVLASVGVIIFISLQISFWWQKRTLLKRLNIKHEHWGELQKERMKLREPQKPCLQLSKLLSELNDISARIVKGQDLTNIPTDKWDKTKNYNNYAFGTLRQLAVWIVVRNLWLRNLFKMDSMAISLMKDLSAMLKELGVGGLVIEENQEYKDKLKYIQDLSIQLPTKIQKQIAFNILVSKILSTGYIFDITNPIFNEWKIDIQPKFKFRLTYWVDGVNTKLMLSRGEINESLENYLVGK